MNRKRLKEVGLFVLFVLWWDQYDILHCLLVDLQENPNSVQR